MYSLYNYCINSSKIKGWADYQWMGQFASSLQCGDTDIKCDFDFQTPHAQASVKKSLQHVGNNAAALMSNSLSSVQKYIAENWLQSS